MPIFGISDCRTEVCVFLAFKRNRKTETDTKDEVSWGGFQYRWNYDEYQRNLEIKKRKAANPGLKVFSVTLTTVFMMCIMTAAAVVLYSHILDTQTADEISNDSYTESKNPQQMQYTPSNPSTVYVSREETPEALTVSQIAEKGRAWVVGIISKSGDTSQIGTGIVVDSDGYIVTNNHVVSGGEEYSIVTDDGSQYTAEMVGADVISDIAVLKINKTDMEAAEIGDSEALVVGETAVAIGTPAGITFAGTVTSGIISGINRDVEIYDSHGLVMKTMTVIQTTAAINYGNSGGPLLNQMGQVVGINTMKLSDGYVGIGFAIPMNGAMPIIESLIENGRVITRPNDSFAKGRAAIGITGEDISQLTSDLYRLPQGVLIKLINPDSDAAKSGLRIGDIIICFDGIQIYTVSELEALVAEHSPGDKVDLYIYRNGKYMTYTFALGEE